MHSWYVKHVVFVLELLSTLDIHLDIFGYLTKIDNTFLICDKFWICFGTFLPHLQKSPGLMTLLNVATAVLGRETRVTRVTWVSWVTCDSWNGCHLDDLAHRLRAAKIRLRGWDMVVEIVVELGTDLEQTWNRGTFRFSTRVFCCCLLAFSKSSWGIHALGKIGQSALLRSCGNKCSRLRVPFSLSPVKNPFFIFIRVPGICELWGSS